MLFNRQLGFDLGTSIMHISQMDKGIILNEPEIIAIDKKTKNVIAFGAEAYDMFEKTPMPILINSPVKYGVVADFDNMSKLLKLQLKKLKMSKNKFSSNTAIVSVPNDVSEVERKALYEEFTNAVKSKDKDKIKHSFNKIMENEIAINKKLNEVLK